MAPKRRSVVGSSAVPTRKRSNVREPSPDSSSATQDDSPPQKIDQLAGKTITTGRKVDFAFLETEGFTFGKLLREMGWEKICSMDVPTYPALVRDFYNDLTRGEGGLVSYVRGTKVTITADILGNILEMPTVGISDYQHDDRSGALSRMLGREVTEFEEILANQLNLELRLLHNICGRILFPKIGRFEYVSERDILIMDCILVGRPVNLAGMMVGYMAECAVKKRSTLPYGMVLTLIFRSQGVPISDNEPLRKLRHTDFYNISTIRRMGFIKVNGQWIRKGQDANIEEGTQAGPSAPPPPPPTMETTQPSSSSTYSEIGFSPIQLEQLRNILSEHDKVRSSEMDVLKEKISVLEDKIDSRLQSISISIDNSVDIFSNELKRIFERLENIGVGSEKYHNSTGQLRKDINLAVSQISDSLDSFKKCQKEDIMEMIGHLKKIVFKHT